MSQGNFNDLNLKVDAVLSQLEDLRAIVCDNLVYKKTHSRNDLRGIDLAMEITGLAKGTIYNLVWKRRIPHYKKHKRIYFDRAQLMKWVREGKAEVKAAPRPVPPSLLPDQAKFTSA